VRRLQQRLFDVVELEHASQDSQRRKASPMRSLWKEIHGFEQSLLPQDDTHQGKTIFNDSIKCKPSEM
jgi:hypothetical protein